MTEPVVFEDIHAVEEGETCPPEGSTSRPSFLPLKHLTGRPASAGGGHQAHATSLRHVQARGGHADSLACPREVKRMEEEIASFVRFHRFT